MQQYCVTVGGPHDESKWQFGETVGEPVVGDRDVGDMEVGELVGGELGDAVVGDADVGDADVGDADVGDADVGDAVVGALVGEHGPSNGVMQKSPEHEQPIAVSLHPVQEPY